MKTINITTNKRGLNILQVAVDHMREHMHDSMQETDIPFFKGMDLTLLMSIKKQIEE